MTSAPAGPPLFGLATGGLPSLVELDRAREIGCDLVELGLCQGQRSLLARAAALADECRRRDLEPVIVLHVGGDVGWTALDAPDRFRDWAREAVAALPRSRRWVPLARPNDEALRRRIRAGAVSTRDLLRELDHQLAAHVLAAEVVRVAEPGATVIAQPAFHRLYELDAMLLDVLLAPAAGVPRDGLSSFLRDRRRIHDEAPAQQPVPPRRRLHRRVARSVIPLDQALPRAASAAYAASTRPIDGIRRDRPGTLPTAVALACEHDETGGGTAPADAAVVWRRAPDDAFRARIHGARSAAGPSAGAGARR